MSRRPNPEAEAHVIEALSLDDDASLAKLLVASGVRDATNCGGCGGRTYLLARRDLLRCRDCKREWSTMSLTPFKGAKIRPAIYLAAIYAYRAAPPVSCLRFSQMADVQYRTAWALKQRLEEWLHTMQAAP